MDHPRGYVDWHERNVETRLRMVGQAQLGRAAQAGIALHRTRKTGRYEAADIERFAVLHRHLKRALAIGLQLGTLGTTLIARAVSNVEIPDGTVRASRPSGKPPYGISVFPVSQNHLALSAFRPAACVVITDPDRNPILPAERLQAAFGLTRAQARLAVALASGDDLRIAAEKLAITYGTARTRLAQIFEKTGTKRQGQLIALMLATVTQL